MKQMIGQEITGKIVDKIKEKTGIWYYNPFPSIEYVAYDQFICEMLEPLHFNSVCILSTTVPWNLCKVLSNFFDIPTTVLGRHPALFLVEDELKLYKNVILKSVNIFTEDVNYYIKNNDLIIIHDYQYMLPLKYLPYDLNNKQVLIFSCNRRFDFDEQINQNFNELTIGNDIKKLTFSKETYYCSKL